MGNLKDYATGIVLTAPSPALSGTSLVLQTGEGDRMPATPFYATAHPPSEMPTLDNAEKVQVTAITDDTLTIVRAQGDTTAKAIEAGWRITNALFLDDIPNTFDDLTDGTTNKAFTSTEKTKLSGIEANADVTDAANVDAAGAVMNSDTSTASMSFVVDQDNMSSDSDTKVPTQQSVKAYVDAAIATAKQALLPVGSIVVLGVNTNPSTLYGFGTWTAIAGRVLVGYDSTQTEFDTLDETGGAKTHTLTTAEMPNHQHLVVDSSVWTGWDGNLVVGGSGGGAANIRYDSNGYRTFSYPNTGKTGGGGAHNNLQPYIVKYMWQRTA